MRFVVLLFGFIGILLTGTVGVMFGLFDSFLDLMKDMAGDKLDFLRTSLTGIAHNDTGLVLFLAAAYGAVGTILGFLRCGKQGGVLLLVPVLFAALMNPYSLVFTWLQVFAGVLCFFVSPLPINSPKKEVDADDEDEEKDDKDDD
jgi:hypothetical protein